MKETLEKLKTHLDNLETALFNLLREPKRPSGWWDLINAEVKAMAADLDRAIRTGDTEARKAVLSRLEERNRVTKSYAVAEGDSPPPA